MKSIDVLNQCRKNFGPIPRSFSFWNRWTCFRLNRPNWLKNHPDDELNQLFENTPTIYREGVVVWGQVVQANSDLMEDGFEDAPGEVIFTLEKQGNVAPKFLKDYSLALGLLKMFPNEDPELEPLIDHLKAETTRRFGYSIPKSLCPDFDLKLSTSIFFRKHLPLERLSEFFLPMVVLPRKPYYALPLPEKFWPFELFDRWSKKTQKELNS